MTTLSPPPARRLAAAVAESATPVGRCTRQSRRDVEALVMAVVLPR
jgi:hypothetical protein